MDLRNVYRRIGKTQASVDYALGLTESDKQAIEEYIHLNAERLIKERNELLKQLDALHSISKPPAC